VKSRKRGSSRSRRESDRDRVHGGASDSVRRARALRALLSSRAWLERLREVFADREVDAEYGSFRNSHMTVGPMLAGSSRLAHLDQLRLDPLFHRSACPRRPASERAFSHWLKDVSRGYQRRLPRCPNPERFPVSSLHVQGSLPETSYDRLLLSAPEEDRDAAERGDQKGDQGTHRAGILAGAKDSGKTASGAPAGPSSRDAPKPRSGNL